MSGSQDTSNMRLKLLLAAPLIVIITLQISSFKDAAAQAEYHRVLQAKQEIQLAKIKADQLKKLTALKKAKAAKAAAAAKAARARQTAQVSTPAITTAQSAQNMTPQQIMAAAGIPAGEQAAADYIVSHESGWRWWVVNTEGSGATGLCQALPGWKMASAGADWATNPVTQMRWCHSYAQSRYGGWWAAYNHWLANHNW